MTSLYVAVASNGSCIKQQAPLRAFVVCALDVYALSAGVLTCAASAWRQNQLQASSWPTAVSSARRALELQLAARCNQRQAADCCRPHPMSRVASFLDLVRARLGYCWCQVQCPSRSMGCLASFRSSPVPRTQHDTGLGSGSRTGSSQGCRCLD